MVTTCQKERKSGTGFTLLELLVVLTIAGLLAAIVPPLYSKAVPGARLKAAARELAVSLRKTRSRAITTGRRMDFRLLSEPPSYTVGNGTAVPLPNGVLITSYDYFAAADKPLEPSNARSGNTTAIYFYPDGSSSGAVVTVANSGDAYRINVSWLTGDVRVARVENDER